MNDRPAAGTARIAASVLRLETIARTQRLRLDADSRRLRSHMDAERDAILKAARRLRETPSWPHALCRWFVQHAARRALTLGSLSAANRRLEHDARVARAVQQHWAMLRRGLERRVALREQA